MLETALESPSKLMFGIGLGNAKFFSGPELIVVFSPLAKAVVKMGVPLALGWLGLFHLLMLRSAVSLAVIIALILPYDLLNGSRIIPIKVYCYLLADAFLAKTSVAVPFQQRFVPVGVAS